jgi:hypothetical protein
MKIAERLLRIRRAQGEIEVPVRVFAPQRDEANSWSCRYEIGWPDAPRTRSIGGFDSVQALFLALQAIGAELYTSEHHELGRLIWEKEGDGYGFPVPRTIRDLLIGDDTIFGG